MSTHIEDDVVHGCGRIGRRTGVFCAFLGVVAAILMIEYFGAQWNGLSIVHALWFLVVMAPLFIAAAYFGTKAGKFLCRKGNRMGLNAAIGVALAFGSITIEVLTWTFVYVVMRGSGEVLYGQALFYAWFAPLALIFMFGGIPAAGLGVLYGFLVRRRLANSCGRSSY